MFIAAWFITAKSWKQLKCPLSEEWIKKLWYTHNGILLSHKENEILPFAATLIDLEKTILGEVKSGRERQILRHLYVESKKNTNEFIYKTEKDSQI